MRNKRLVPSLAICHDTYPVQWLDRDSGSRMGGKLAASAQACCMTILQYTPPSFQGYINPLATIAGPTRTPLATRLQGSSIKAS